MLYSTDQAIHAVSVDFKGGMQGGGCKLSAFVSYLCMVHATMLSVTRTTQCGVNNELGWKVEAMS
jgi:hypothetical protein